MAALPPLPASGAPRLSGPLAGARPDLPRLVGRPEMAHGTGGQVGALQNPQLAIRVGSPTDSELILQMSAVLYFGGAWQARAQGHSEYCAPQSSPRAAMLAALEAPK